MIEIRHFVGRSGIDSIESDWQSLLARLPRRRHLHYPEWYRAYLDGYEADEGELHLFAAYDAGTLLAVFPLRYARERLLGLPLRHYSLLAGDNIALADIVCDPTVPVDSVLTALNAYLAINRALTWDMISFRHILEDSHLLSSNITGFWRTLLRPHRACDYIMREQPYDVYFASLSKNFRSKMKKARNKLREAGGGIYLSTRDPALLSSYYQEFLDVEASGWKGAHGSGTAIKLNPSMDQFYRSLLENFGREGRCEIILLKVSELTIAGQFCLVCDDTMYQFKIGYREDFAPFSPGRLLDELLLKEFDTNRAEIRYLNLVSDAPWHRDFRPRRMQVSNLFAFNRTPVGLFAYVYTRARQLLSRLRRRITKPESHAPAHETVHSV